MVNSETNPSAKSSLRFGVTGAGGYVGGAIVRYLQGAGQTVYQLRHFAGMAGDVKGTDPLVRAFSLQNIRPGIFDGIDVLVHAAYDFRAFTPDEIQAVNVDGSIRLFEATRAANVGRIIFISSISAFDGCQSQYGQAKLRVEKRAAELGVTIVRPGLVYGPRRGGMMAALEKLVSLPLCPMVGNGDALQYLVHQDDLARLVFVLANAAPELASQPVIAAHSEGRTSKEVMVILGDLQGKQNLHFIGVPPILIRTGLQTLEACGLRPRLRSDSLVGLLHQDPSPDFSVAAKLGVDFRPFNLQTISISSAE
jgi:nucleoside-diphosphate-sugar epimerase